MFLKTTHGKRPHGSTKSDLKHPVLVGFKGGTERADEAADGGSGSLFYRNRSQAFTWEG